MTIDQLRARHSVRSYSLEQIPEKSVKAIEALVTDINSHEAGMHIQLITNSDAPFHGFTRSYGMFRGVRNYLAMVVDNSFPFMRQKVGFYGEQIALKALELGLATCFVGGTYSSKNVDARIRPGEELICILSIGIPLEQNTSAIAKMMRNMVKRRSKTPEQLYESSLPLEEACKLFPPLPDGLEAVAAAPSAMNNQPVMIGVVPGNESAEADERLRITASVKEANSLQQVDLGAAMYNFQAIVPGSWQWGNPAIFIPD